MARQGIEHLLRFVGDNPEREGLAKTPERVVRSMLELTSGYGVDVDKLLTTTFDSESYDQLIVVAGIRIVSLCEHHLLPFTGTATVGYIPGDGRIVGLSKLARVVDAFARRLQVQERLTEQVADALERNLKPKGAGVVIRAHHSCMGLRGPLQPNATMTTSSLRGVLLSKPEARAEFLALAKDGHL